MSFKNRFMDGAANFGNKAANHIKDNASKYGAAASILGAGAAGAAGADIAGVDDDYRNEAKTDIDNILTNDVAKQAADNVYNSSSTPAYVDALQKRDNAGLWDRTFNIDELDKNVHDMRAQDPHLGGVGKEPTPRTDVFDDAGDTLKTPLTWAGNKVDGVKDYLKDTEDAGNKAAVSFTNSIKNAPESFLNNTSIGRDAVRIKDDIVGFYNDNTAGFGRPKPLSDEQAQTKQFNQGENDYNKNLDLDRTSVDWDKEKALAQKAHDDAISNKPKNEYISNIHNKYTDVYEPHLINGADTPNNIKGEISNSIQSNPEALANAQRDILQKDSNLTNRLQSASDDYTSATSDARRNYGALGSLAGAGLFAGAKKLKDLKNKGTKNGI